MQAALITMSAAASFHLILVGVVAILQRDISYINPLDFLGLSIIWPQYRDIGWVALGGWAALLIAYLSVVYISIRFQLYLSVIREHPLIKKLSESSRKLQETIHQQTEIYEQTTRELLAKQSRNKNNKK